MPASIAADELALVARLGRGLEHRINNLTTVLMICSQQISEFESVPAGERSEVQEVIDRTITQLSLLTHVLGAQSERSELGATIQGVASVVSGLHHRVTVRAEPCDEERWVEVPSARVGRMLIAACLVAHAVAANGGAISLRVLPQPLGLEVECSPKAKTQLTQLVDADDRATADLRLARTIAEALGFELQQDESPEALRLAFTRPQ